jgi:hypothetical protein
MLSFCILPRTYRKAPANSLPGKSTGDYTATFDDHAARRVRHSPFLREIPSPHNHRTRHTRPNHICCIMGVQQRSSKNAYRLRSSCILPHFSAVTVLVDLHIRLEVNPLGSHQPAHQALSHQQEDQQQEKGRDPYLSTNSSRRKEMILCPPTPLYQIPCMIRSGRSSMTHGRELIRPSTTQWSKRTGTSGDYCGRRAGRQKPCRVWDISFKRPGHPADR